MKLAQALLDTGMLEIGLFQAGQEQVPFRFRLEMLPSYPDILQEVADDALPLVADLKIDRLVCPLDVLPFGTALSLKSGIPLVYSRGRGESPVFDLVGAYDVGHPACLLLNVFDDGAIVAELTRAAKSVGLNIRHMLAIIDTETVPSSEITRARLLTLSQLTDGLQAADLMSPLLAAAVVDWQRKHAVG